MVCMRILWHTAIVLTLNQQSCIGLRKLVSIVLRINYEAFEDTQFKKKDGPISHALVAREMV